MRVLINGTDITPYIKYRGFKWQRSDVDSAKSGRNTLDAKMHRNRVAKKRRLDIECRPLTAEEAEIVLNLIDPEWVEVTYFDPQEGAEVTRTMYSNNYPAAYLRQYEDGTEMWDGISFPLIEE